MLQPRFNRRSGVKSLSLLQHPRFRAAYRFPTAARASRRGGPGIGSSGGPTFRCCRRRREWRWFRRARRNPPRRDARLPAVAAAAGGAAERRAVNDGRSGARRTWRSAAIWILRASVFSKHSSAWVNCLRPAVQLRSRLYLTRPLGPQDQPQFVNAAVGTADATRARRICWRNCSGIERVMGRERQERWGPRVIDLDLVWMVDSAVDEPGLTLPHPGVSTRNFVLYPLADIAPTLNIPGDGPRARS